MAELALFGAVQFGLALILFRRSPDNGVASLAAQQAANRAWAGLGLAGIRARFLN